MSYYSHYDVSFPLRTGVTEKDIAKWLADKKPEFLRLDDAGDFIIEPVGRQLQISGGASMSGRSDVDIAESFKQLAVAFADWSRGAMLVCEESDTFDDGPNEWLFGPERVILEEGIAERERAVSSIENELVRMTRELETAGGELAVQEC